MLVRNECVQEDASSLQHNMRSESGILTPDTKGSVEGRNNSRKRKIEEVSEETGAYDLFNEDFSVKVRFIYHHAICYVSI